MTQPASFEKKDKIQGMNDLKGSSEAEGVKSPSTHQADENHDNEVFGSVQDVEPEVFPESCVSRYWPVPKSMSRSLC